MKLRWNHHYTTHFFLQGLSATVFMWLVLIGLDRVLNSQILWAVGASTLASSAFIVFVTPKAVVAAPYKIIVSYLIALLCAVMVRLATSSLCTAFSLCTVGGVPGVHVFEVAAAISLGISILLMVLLRSEHPPAAGLAVVMVLEIHNAEALAVILVSAVILAAIRLVFRNRLINLI
ncbi:MAG: hypothetical protein A3F41_05835 [Coxiella sp. RIFCSPHIGHO2_12_FULL_44_14]|nr:MAG: hypothetical protein A3F41_05835 [Coxiella sp. RIFCSPHIGHO2_12_FULL_44_14]